MAGPRQTLIARERVNPWRKESIQEGFGKSPRFCWSVLSQSPATSRPVV